VKGGAKVWRLAGRRKTVALPQDFLGAVLAMLVTRRVEIEPLILVLLTVLRAGVANYEVKWQIPA